HYFVLCRSMYPASVPIFTSAPCTSSLCSSSITPKCLSTSTAISSTSTESSPTPSLPSPPRPNIAVSGTIGTARCSFNPLVNTSINCTSVGVMHPLENQGSADSLGPKSTRIADEKSSVPVPPPPPQPKSPAEL